MNKSNFKNRIAALLLAMLMVVGLVPAQAFAEGSGSAELVVPETQTEPAVIAETAEQADASDAADAVESADQADAADAVETADQADASDSVETAEQTDASDIAETADQADVSDTVETAEQTEPADAAEFVFTAPVVYLTEILDALGIDVANNSVLELDVDRSIVTLSDTVAKNSNLAKITLTAQEHFELATLTINKNKNNVQRVTLSYPEPADPQEPEIILADDAEISAGEAVSLKGSLPQDAIAQAAPVQAEIPGLKAIAAYDISIFAGSVRKTSGTKWQPTDSAVRVQIKDSALDSLNGQTVDIYHIPDGAEPEYTATATVADGAVEFDATGFSVYVIVEHEGGEIVEPRVEFHFIAPVAENYAPETTGGVAYYTSSPYLFNNKAAEEGAGKQQVSMIVRDSDVLESIEAPMNTQSTYFYGWYTVDKSADNVVFNPADQTYSGTIRYSWPLADPLRVELDKAVSVSADRRADNSITSVTWTIDGVSGTSTDIDAEGCAHVYLAPIYSNYYFVNFHLGPVGDSTAASIMTRKLIVLGNSNQTNVLISDIEATTTDPIHKMFIGWERNLGTTDATNWTFYRTIDNNGNNISYSITVGEENVDLYPRFVEIRWINYNIGASHNGAAYKAPMFMYTSDNNHDEYADDNAISALGTASRVGYDFGGWYVNAFMKDSVIMNLNGPYTDPNTGTTWTQAIKIADASGQVVTGTAISAYTDGNGNFSYSETSGYSLAYKVENGKLYVYTPLDALPVYANWVPNSVSFTIVYWTENADNDNYVANVVRTVTTTELSAATGRSFAAGSTVLLSDLATYTTTAQLGSSGAVEVDDAKFFELNGSRSDASAVINGDGSTQFNVYFNRKVFTLVFHIGMNGYVSTGGGQSSHKEDWSDGFLISKRTGDRQNDGYYSITFEGNTYDNSYVSNNGDPNRSYTYVPDPDNNSNDSKLYLIKAKYGAYIGDKWPAVGNPGFVFDAQNNHANDDLYIWSANYHSLFWAQAHNQGTGGTSENPDLTGIYNYMSRAICADWNGDPLPNQVHHLVAYYYKNASSHLKTHHFMYAAIDGTASDGKVTVPGSGFVGNGYTKTAQALPSGAGAVQSNSYYEESTFTFISEQSSANQLYVARDGYDFVYACYKGTDIYFFYTPKQYTLTFSKDPASVNFTEDKEDTYYYGQSLSGARKYADPAKTNYRFINWYTNAAGAGAPFDFENETMPSSNIVLYPVFEIVKYRIKIDPNGGIMDHIDYGTYAGLLTGTGLENNTGHNTSFSTFFNNTAEEYIEIDMDIKRPYVQISDAEASAMSAGTVYRYVNTQFYPEYGSFAADARNALYILDTPESIAAYYSYYCQVIADTNDGTPLPQSQWESVYLSQEKYRKLHGGEVYELLGWYEVNSDGSVEGSPFDFSEPTTQATTLRALWRLDGGYTLQYTTEYYAPNRDYITGNLTSWTDPSDGTKYADGATTQAMQEPTAIKVNGADSDEYQFLGWQIVHVETVGGQPHYTEQEPGVYYTAGQPMKVQGKFADANMVIHIQAVYEKRSEAYRRPEVIDLTLDASRDAQNAGTGSIDTSKGDWPVWTRPGHYYSDSSHIYFGDAQSNSAVHLYKYATTLTESEQTGAALAPAGVNFFVHSAGYKLIGFDLDAPDDDYVPDYAADAVVAVSPGSSHVLYAVWEPMVYLTFVNDTNVGPVTFNLGGTGQAMYIVNKVNGSFSRVALDPSQAVTVAEGETLRLVVPYGDGEAITVSGTNTLGTGYLLTARSELGTTAPVARSLSGTYSRVPNSEGFSFSDTLLTDAEGVVITFTAEKAPHTLVLDDNYTGGGTKEVTFSEKASDHTVYYNEESTTSYVLPSTSTRIGWELLGWDKDPAATTPEYKTGAWTITDLTEFFTSSGSSAPDIEVETLYAIWKANADASIVYVWKDVPTPGDQNKEFSFTVEFGGRFDYTESESYGLLGNRYRWKSSPNTGNNIANNTAQGGGATLSGTFTLKHNQYLKIVTENEQTNGNRPYLKMTVTKWQRNIDGTPDTQINADGQTAGNNEVVLSWYWRNTTRTGNPNGTGQYKDFKFRNLTLSVTEGDYSSQYEQAVDIAEDTTDAKLTADNGNRKVFWDDTHAGGTVIFTNTRKTADVTIKKTLLPDTLDPERFTFTAEFTNAAGSTHSTQFESYTLNPISKNVLSGGTEEWVIPEVPTGAVLQITETPDPKDRFTVVANGRTDALSANVTDLDSSDNGFRFTVAENSTVTFTNTLKTNKIRLVVEDEEGNKLDSANFTFPNIFDGTKFSAATTGQVFQDEVYVGEYTLTETLMPDHAGVRYIKLQSPVLVTITDDNVSVPAGTQNVRIEAPVSPDEYWTITVINPKMMRVTVKKIVDDADTSGTFGFTVSLTDAAGDPISLSNVYGTQGTGADGLLPFTLINNQSALLYIPKGAILSVSETPDGGFDTEYQYGADEAHLNAKTNALTVQLGTEDSDSDGTADGVTGDMFVLFTNTRKLAAPTGLELPVLPFVLMAAFGAALGLVSVPVIVRKRRREEE